MRQNLRVAVAFLVVACGPSSNATNDAGVTVPRNLEPTELQCQTHTRTAVASGVTTEIRTHFALVDGVTRDDDFAVELCDQVTIQNGVNLATQCASGSTCSDSGPALPTGQLCSWSRRSATFTADGKLFVVCGNGNSFIPSGSPSTITDTRFTTVRIWK